MFRSLLSCHEAFNKFYKTVSVSGFYNVILTVIQSFVFVGLRYCNWRSSGNIYIYTQIAKKFIGL